MNDVRDELFASTHGSDKLDLDDHLSASFNGNVKVNNGIVAIPSHRQRVYVVERVTAFKLARCKDEWDGVACDGCLAAGKEMKNIVGPLCVVYKGDTYNEMCQACGNIERSIVGDNNIVEIPSPIIRYTVINKKGEQWHVHDGNNDMTLHTIAETFRDRKAMRRMVRAATDQMHSAKQKLEAVRMNELVEKCRKRASKCIAEANWLVDGVCEVPEDDVQRFQDEPYLLKAINKRLQLSCRASSENKRRRLMRGDGRVCTKEEMQAEVDETMVVFSDEE